MPDWRCVETFLYNLCNQLKDYYDITVLYGDGDLKQLGRLARLVDIERYNKDNTYKCDICIRNSVWGQIPNIEAKRYIEIQHADYQYLKEKGRLESQYHIWDKIQEHISCGEYVAKRFKQATGQDSIAIRNILSPKVEVNKIYKFITCSRLDSGKGVKRMEQMIDMMRKANIKFRWDIYTNDEFRLKSEEITLHKARSDIWDYLADADYTVLLSDCEGLPYTVQESLQYGTPCIVTDVGGCTELIKHEVNGYVVPLDMNFDINIIKDIPVLEEYKGTTAEDWIKVLGKPGKKEVTKKMYELEAIRDFDYSQYELLVSIKRKKDDKKYHIFRGDILTVRSKAEMEYLTGNNPVKLIGCKLLRTIDEKVTKVEQKHYNLEEESETLEEKVDKVKEKPKRKTTKKSTIVKKVD